MKLRAKYKEIIMASYSKIKTTIIDLIDDEAINHDVLAQYGAEYEASTKLDDIGVTAPIRAGMPKGVNKAMRLLVGGSWKAVGPIDLVQLQTIGDFILLVCGQSGISCPAGEPS